MGWLGMAGVAVIEKPGQEGGRWSSGEEPRWRYQRLSAASQLLFLLNYPCANTLFLGVKLLFSAFLFFFFFF